MRDWTEVGVWPRLHEVLLAELKTAGLLDMDDTAVDGSHVELPKTSQGAKKASRLPGGARAVGRRRVVRRIASGSGDSGGAGRGSG